MTRVETYEAERDFPEFLEQELQQYAINIKPELYNCLRDVTTEITMEEAYESKSYEIDILFNDEKSTIDRFDSDTLVYRFLKKLIKNRNSYNEIVEFLETDYELKINKHVFRITDPQYPVKDLFPETETHSLTPEEPITEPEDTDCETAITVDFILTKDGLTQKINHVFLDRNQRKNFPENISEVLFITGVKDGFIAARDCVGAEKADYLVERKSTSEEVSNVYATNDIVKAHQYENREDKSLETVNHTLVGSVLDYPPADITWYSDEDQDMSSTYLKLKSISQYIYLEDNDITDFELFCLENVPYVSDPNNIEKGITVAVHWIESAIREIVKMDEREYNYLEFFEWLADTTKELSDDFEIEEHFHRIQQADNYQTPLEEEMSA